MKKAIKIILANPAGNITIFVLDPVERKNYAKIANQLLSMNKLNAEQIAYVKDQKNMDMCGLEFCGNASRAFALLSAMEQGIDKPVTITVNVSGSDKPLDVFVDPKTNFAKIKMPQYLGAYVLDHSPIYEAKGSIIVDLGGITHLIVHGISPSMDNFKTLSKQLIEKYDPPACGVMFMEEDDKHMTPVVYVRDVSSTYFEGSCASGSAAASIAFSLNKSDGKYTYRFIQPAGVVISSVEIKNGDINAVCIEGHVEFSEVIDVEVDL